jgi:peptidylprolyl isomerase domain and WD repeat-containing protein 1
MTEKTETKKRKFEENEVIEIKEEEKVEEKVKTEEEEIKTKKKKTYNTDKLPTGLMYEKSYMHKKRITHIEVAPTTSFIISASIDGIIKFWKKKETDIDFVKEYKAHTSEIDSLYITPDGSLMTTLCNKDMTLNIFDVLNFDMINIIKLEKECTTCCIMKTKEEGTKIMVVEKESNNIYEYNFEGELKNKITLKQHNNSIIILKYNEKYEMATTIDSKGFLNY